VGNPCNTNCYIARMNAPELPAERWFAMTRLDENRARTQIALKAKVPVAAVTNVGVWGNHSTTQYPDAANARIAGLPVFEVISDHGWLKGKLVETIQKRGASVIEARGASSAASAANAVIGSVVSIREPTPWGDWHSLAVVSHGEYGVPEGLQFGFPVRSDGEHWEVVPDLHHDDDAWKRIRVTTQELLQEQEMVKGARPELGAKPADSPDCPRLASDISPVCPDYPLVAPHLSLIPFPDGVRVPVPEPMLGQ